MENTDIESKKLDHEPPVYSYDHESHDIGQSLYNQALAMDPQRRDDVAKKVKSKLDRVLIPMVSAVATTYSLLLGCKLSRCSSLTKY